jgi:hypothetical protein
MMGISPAKLGGADLAVFAVMEKVFPYAYPVLADLYFPCDTPAKPMRTFWDHWLGSLPMDQVEYSSDLFNLVYSEMWVPANMATTTVNTLQNYYDEKGYSATGFYTVEILAAKQSNFWLSPAYGGDAVRFNILYFKKAVVNPESYFEQFWQLLNENKINFRPHWGKNLPPPNSTTGPAYLQSQYPKWSNFLALRKQMDPNNIFLNSYWKAQLGI